MYDGSGRHPYFGDYCAESIIGLALLNWGTGKPEGAERSLAVEEIFDDRQEFFRFIQHG